MNTSTEEHDGESTNSRDLPHPRPRKKDIFDLFTFAGGMYGFLHEVLAGQTEARWGILVVSGVMMGLGKSLDVVVRIMELTAERNQRDAR